MAKLKHKTKIDFTVVSNTFIRDTRLDFFDKGLMLQIISLPENWDFSMAGLLTLGKDSEKTADGKLIYGMGALKRGIKNLKKYGYLEWKRLKGIKGRWTTEVEVYQVPKLIDDHSGVDEGGDDHTGEHLCGDDPHNKELNDKELNNKINNNKLNKIAATKKLINYSEEYKQGSDSYNELKAWCDEYALNVHRKVMNDFELVNELGKMTEWVELNKVKHTNPLRFAKNWLEKTISKRIVSIPANSFSSTSRSRDIPDKDYYKSAEQLEDEAIEAELETAEILGNFTAKNDRRRGMAAISDLMQNRF